MVKSILMYKILKISDFIFLTNILMKHYWQNLPLSERQPLFRNVIGAFLQLSTIHNSVKRDVSYS